MPNAAQAGPDPDDEPTWSHVPPAVDVLSFEDEAARRRLQQQMFGVDLPPVRVGRFALERQLGAGGMGTVWAAWDEELERTVALKFLRREDDPGQARLLDEARALAKLSHPNVVSVFDVGESDGRVWIAMELVAGRTLRMKDDHERLGPREVLGWWLAAGRGLAAVHALGLVHRDVKPDNVLLGDDGRVRLIDFGLVCGFEPPGGLGLGRGLGLDDDEGLSTITQAPVAASDTPRQRGFTGTRAYAAPEQLADELLDARADQYAFAVSLTEALTGTRPRGPEDLAALAKLPRRQRQALTRALARDPSQRFDDMLALLDALEPPRHRRVLLALAGTGLLAGALGFALAPEGEPPPQPCARVDAPIDELWTPARRAQLGAGLDAALGERGRAAVDGWVEQWRGAARASCQASLIDQVRSPVAHDRRMACLDRRLDGLAGMLRASEVGELDGGGRLAAWLDGLDDPALCMSEGIASAGPGPAPAAIADEVAQLRRSLMHARVTAGPLLERAAVAADIERRAGELEWPVLEGESALVLLRLQRQRGDATAARAAGGRALDLARDSGDIELEAEAWSGLLGVARNLELDAERAAWSLERRAAAVARLGEAPRQQARLSAERGLHALMHDDLEAAVSLLREAEAALARLGPLVAWERAATLHDLGNALARAGQREAALDSFAAARDLELELELDLDGSSASEPRGASPRVVAHALLDQGWAEFDAGRVEQAELSFAEALDAYIDEQGPRGKGVIRARLALATLADARGDLDGAREQLDIAAQVSVTSFGAVDSDRADLLSALGTIAHREGRYEAAAEAFERVLTIREALEPDAVVNLALARSNLAEALHGLGKDRQAAALLERAIPALEGALAPGHSDLAYPLAARAEVALALGDAAAASDAAERALALFEVADQSAVERARVLWLAAQAARADGRHDHARERGEQALRAHEDLGNDWLSTTAQIRRWLEAPNPTQESEQ